MGYEKDILLDFEFHSYSEFEQFCIDENITTKEAFRRMKIILNEDK
jgi:hypothetical protein